MSYLWMAFFDHCDIDYGTLEADLPNEKIVRMGFSSLW